MPANLSKKFILLNYPDVAVRKELKRWNFLFEDSVEWLRKREEVPSELRKHLKKIRASKVPRLLRPTKS